MIAPPRGRLVATCSVLGCLAISGCGGGSASTGAVSGSGTATGGSGGAGVSADAVSGSGAAAGSGAAGASGSAAAGSASVSISARTVGQPIPSGFLGFSFEFQAVRAYEGRNQAGIDPVFVQLIRNLTPGQAPVLRIGGDSTDFSYVPAPGVRRPAFVRYALTPGWLATTARLAHELGARMILGINLAANYPALAADEAKAFLHAFGRRSIEAFEIGNEPNIYSVLTNMHTVFGLPVPIRPRGFDYPAFRRQFEAEAAAVARAAPGPGLAGPALAAGPTAGSGSWVRVLHDLLARTPRLTIMTVHRYPLRNCFVPPSSPQYPSIPHLLSRYATTGLAASVKPWLAIAHAQHRLLRIDELNSVACFGKPGVSDTFATALWATDALFSLARAGVSGVNVHTLPAANYRLFRTRHVHGRWQAAVAPVYYGMQLFAQAAPSGSRLLAVSRRGSTAGLSAWATRTSDATVRVVLIDKDPSRGRTVTLTLPAGAGSTATIERMQAPNVASRGDVKLGGRSYGSETSTGLLGAPIDARERVTGGRLTVKMPAGSAALVTVAPGG